MRKLFVLISISIFFIYYQSCSSSNKLNNKAKQKTSKSCENSSLGFSISDVGKNRILNLCIDSSLKIDPGLNTKSFWIDFSKVNFFNDSNISSFMKNRSNFQIINSDSLFKFSLTWIKYDFFEKMLIMFKKIEYENDSIIIFLDKIVSGDGGNGIKIIIKKINDEYYVISSELIWIS